MTEAEDEVVMVIPEDNVANNAKQIQNHVDLFQHQGQIEMILSTMKKTASPLISGYGTGDETPQQMTAMFSKVRSIMLSQLQ